MRRSRDAGKSAVMIAVFFLAVVTFFGSVWWLLWTIDAAKTIRELEKRLAKMEAEIAKIEIIELEPEPENDDDFRQLAQFELAVVSVSDGIENSVIRQLIYNPGLLEQDERLEKYAFNGDPKDKKAIKAWAYKTADILAVLAGYVDLKTRREIRIKKPDATAFVLAVEEGQIVFKEYEMRDGSFELVRTVPLADSLAEAQFQSDVQTFQYVWTPPTSAT